jgi:hypothetical protein
MSTLDESLRYYFEKIGNDFGRIGVYQEGDRIDYKFFGSDCNDLDFSEGMNPKDDNFLLRRIEQIGRISLKMNRVCTSTKEDKNHYELWINPQEVKVNLEEISVSSGQSVLVF